MEESQVISALSALAQETRLRIIRFLVRQGTDGATAGSISDAVNTSPSALSFHMAALEKGGLVSKTSKSRNIIYTAEFTALAGVSAFLFEECCAEMTPSADCC